MEVHMRSLVRIGLTTLVAALIVTFVGARGATLPVVDPAMEWNQIALDATLVAPAQGPVPQVRTMTIVHLAVHDAINVITREFKTYLADGPAPDGASPEAAAIAAAHTVLVTTFPGQAANLNNLRALSLAANGVTEADPGIGVGEASAAAILTRAANDGFASAGGPYTAPGAGNPGVWIAIGPAAPILPRLGSVTPWVLREGSQFRPDSPPSLTSRRYARDFNEVKEIGSATSLTRTLEQTNIAQFWLATPTFIWNGIARQVLTARDQGLSGNARVFALMFLASSDASIACWDAKYHYNFWRPHTAIRNADVDGNPNTDADPTWLPLGTTPQHPEYVSGHSTNSSAMATTLTLLFGDDPGVAMTAMSNTNPGFLRQWTEFSEGIEEVIDARVYSGFHYRTSDEVGARLGRRVARFVVNHALKKARGRDR
jgi:hypothetical protein